KLGPGGQVAGRALLDRPFAPKREPAPHVEGENLVDEQVPIDLGQGIVAIDFGGERLRLGRLREESPDVPPLRLPDLSYPPFPEAADPLESSAEGLVVESLDVAVLQPLWVMSHPWTPWSLMFLIPRSSIDISGFATLREAASRTAPLLTPNSAQFSQRRLTTMTTFFGGKPKMLFLTTG